MSEQPPEREPHVGLHALLEHMGKIEASDLYLVADHPPVFRVDDASYPAQVPLAADEIERMADSLMSASQRMEFRATFEMNVTFAWSDDVRFRVSLFFQRGTQAMVVRRLHTRIKTLEELGLLLELPRLALIRNGLVLVVGDKRSGRSTTLAALIDHRNTSQEGHILTIEDPIEFVHARKQCVVTQREVGVDTCSWADALRNAPNQTPDLICASEIRDAQTMETLLGFAESGQACFASLNASNATHAVERVWSFFPQERHSEIRMRLSRALRGVIAQRLVPALPHGRVVAVEILIDTPQVMELILRGQLAKLGDGWEQAGPGCCTFDASLFALSSAGRISQVEALKAADHAPELLLRMRRVNDGQAYDKGKVREAPLRLADDSYDTPAPAAVSAPAADRRAKTGPIR